MRSIVITALLNLSAAAASAGGIVNVTFVDPDSFYDAGNTKQDAPLNLKIIEQHFKDLGQRFLSDDQVLNISVLDVDLAGYTRPAGRFGAVDVRLARGKDDWPRITARYSLEVNGVPIKSAQEVLADLNYGRHGPMYLYTDRDPLRYEKLLIHSWFEARFKRQD